MNRRQNKQEVLPELVYHYTSLGAMMNIVKTRSLWCTSISYMNDANERRFLINAAKRRLPVLQRLGQIDSDFRVEPKGMRRFSPRTPRKNEKFHRTSFKYEPFSTSFTDRPDSLRHWRHYCPRESGVALGFRSDCLRRAVVDDFPVTAPNTNLCLFDKVKYLDPNNDADVDNLAIREACQRVEYVARLPLVSRERLLHGFGMAIGAIACMSKHSAFEDEAEYRLVQMGLWHIEDKLCFREVKSTLVPYVSLHIPNQGRREMVYNWREDPLVPWDALATVILGPSPNLTLTNRSVSAFFALQGMDVEVQESSIAYRDW